MFSLLHDRNIYAGRATQFKAFSRSLVSLSFMTPLHVAAERAHNDILEVLQKHGAKVSAACIPPLRLIQPER